MQMSGTVYGNGQIPAVRGTDLSDDDGELAVMEVEGGRTDAEIAAGLNEGIPALVEGGGGLDGALEAGNGEFAIQDAMEHSAEDHMTGGIELFIAEKVHRQADGDAEQDQRHTTGVRGTGQEGEGGNRASAGIDHVGSAAGSESPGEEAVVDVTAVGAENGLVAEKAAGDGESGIEEGNEIGRAHV